jgi:hypothetical protein
LALVTGSLADNAKMTAIKSTRKQKSGRSPNAFEKMDSRDKPGCF